MTKLLDALEARGPNDPHVLEGDITCPDYQPEGERCVFDKKACPFKGDEAKCGEND